MTLPAQSASLVTAPHVSDVLTLSEASELLRIDRVTLGRLIRARKIPAANVGTGKRPVYRLARKDLLAWLSGANGVNGAFVAPCDPTPVAGDGGLPSPASDAKRSISPRRSRARKPSASQSRDSGPCTIKEELKALRDR